ncbi:polyprenol monophosphomannose synthase [Desulforhopalus singaporensis]|uniref:Glycosyl transferase family 2 n=1 Tax=Desulforhopalus singaporensis TaxID=91360 RepID=A0A1H0UAR6_9BACT|nr:polyprenol monophosphomannose synthase [Desulforhopalus singaporensis]SDP62916.1 Glycosyl transferase family 2 [Desulforhopalus singaporensis]
MAIATVIIPTLNEEENIDNLLERLVEVQRGNPFAFDILFVDSASEDETQQKVLAWQKRAPVRLLAQKFNVGLAGAVMAGARHATADLVVVMDADLSHPPEDIPRLLQPLVAGTSNMSLGSRYTAGSAMPDWPVGRKIKSRLATIPARMFCDVKDPLSGFFAIERDLLVSLPGTVPGFKIALALLAQYRKTIRVVEIPIVFCDRNCGSSKMSCSVVFAYLRQLVSLFARHYPGR